MLPAIKSEEISRVLMVKVNFALWQMFTIRK